MDQDTRKKLVDQYKEGYRVVSEALVGRDRRGARRAAGAGQVERPRDRPPPRRQRDDLGDPPAHADRRRQSEDLRLRPGRVRAAAALRSAARGVARSVQGRASIDRRAPRLPDRSRMAARRAPTPSTAATTSCVGSRSTPRTHISTRTRSKSREVREEVGQERLRPCLAEPPSCEILSTEELAYFQWRWAPPARTYADARPRITCPRARMAAGACQYIKNFDADARTPLPQAPTSGDLFRRSPASICSRSSDDPARMSNGSFSCSYSYGGWRQANRRVGLREMPRRAPRR